METQAESSAIPGSTRPESVAAGTHHHETHNEADSKGAGTEARSDPDGKDVKTASLGSPDAAKSGLAFPSTDAGCVSPHSSLKADYGRPRPVMVEECPDLGESPSLAALPLSDPSEAPRRSSQAPPSTPKSSKVSVKSETTVTQTPHMTERRSETAGEAKPSRRQSNSLHSPRPHPKRPRALDYLVSDSTTGISRAALETAYRRFDMGPGRASPARSVLSRRPSISRDTSRPIDSRTQATWTSSRTGPIRAVSMPLHHSPSVLPSPYTSLQPGTATLPAASMAPLYSASSVSQAGWPVEKTPMSGYQLLAAKLVGGLGGPPVVPAYRRFEALNHRLLLYMQADIVDLESHLRDLDAQDTAERAYGAIPASHRHERWANSGLAQQKAEILGQIGYKLQQYNKVLFSMRKLQQPPPPSLAEIHAYKSWLINSRLIAEDETHFLDASEDLVSLALQPPASVPTVDSAMIPMHQSTEHAVFSMPNIIKVPEPEAARNHQLHTRDALGTQLSQIVLAMCTALFVPVATFSVISGFAGRIAVVLVVEVGVTVALLQSGLVHLLDGSSSNWLLSASIYFGAMAAVAGLLC